MTRTHTRTHTRARFIAGETAPGAKEALGGTLVPNRLGNIALEGFRVNQLRSASEVRLDLTTKPPTLYLTEALTTERTGYIDADSGEFVEFDNELSHSEREVTGTYVGPGSELLIR